MVRSHFLARPLARPLALAAGLLVLLAAAPAHAGPPTKAEQVRAARARAKRLTSKKHVHQAMHEAKGKGMGPCKVLGKEAVAAGKDLVLRGVDPGFLEAITALGQAEQTARSKDKTVAGHHISHAQWITIAASTCQSEVDDLKTERKKLEKKAPKASRAPAACKALDHKLEHACWAQLRAGKVPDACQQVSSAFGMGMGSHAQTCKIAASMIP